jgi:hypothetical protein
MNDEILLIRPRRDKPNHNLWLNNQTWSIAFTIHAPGKAKRRVRKSLGTKEIAVARQRRDVWFSRYQRKSGQPGNGRASGQNSIENNV